MMRIAGCAVVLTLLGGCLFVKAVQADTFEYERREAEANVRSRTGSEYDKRLGEYMLSLPLFANRMDKCIALGLKLDSLQQSVSGYYRFNVDGSYRLVLRPSGQLADCVEAVLEGRKVPLPPRLPYLNAFEFSVQAQ